MFASVKALASIILGIVLLFALAAAFLALGLILGAKFETGVVLDAATRALMAAPFFATWLMPNWISLLTYPVFATGMWWCGLLLDAKVPQPTGPDGTPLLMCGMPVLGAMFAGVISIFAAVLGRAIGLGLGQQPRGVVYFAQIAPLCALFALGACLAYPH